MILFPPTYLYLFKTHSRSPTVLHLSFIVTAVSYVALKCSSSFYFLSEHGCLSVQGIAFEGTKGGAVHRLCPFSKEETSATQCQSYQF